MLPDGTSVQMSANFQPLQDAEGEVNGVVISFRDVTEQMLAHRTSWRSQERLRAAYAVARLSSWEWTPPRRCKGVPGARRSSPLTGTTLPLDDVLAGIAAREPRRAARGLRRAPGRGPHETVQARQAWPTPTAGCSGWRPASGRSTTRTDALIRLRGTTQDVTEQELAKQAGRRRARLLPDDPGLAVRPHRRPGPPGPDHHDQPGLGRVRRGRGRRAGGPGRRLPGGVRRRARRARRHDAPPPGCARSWAGSRTSSSRSTRATAPTAKPGSCCAPCASRDPGDACVVVSHEDVTDRHLAQQDVATQAALLDEVDVAVVATDNDGLVTRWNRGAEKLYGWTADEMVGRSAAKVLSPAGSDEARPTWPRSGRTGRKASSTCSAKTAPRSRPRSMAA